MEPTCVKRALQIENFSLRAQPLRDGQVFDELYSHTHLIVFRYIYGLHNGPAEDVEDLAAETYLRAWKARSRFQGDEGAALGWLLTIARRPVIDAHRRKKVRGVDQNIETLALPSAGDSPEEQSIHRERRQTLRKVMQSLSMQQREILTLRYSLGWRVKDIGAHLEIAENTISVNLRRALQRIRDLWPVD